MQLCESRREVARWRNERFAAVCYNCIFGFMARAALLAARDG